MTEEEFVRSQLAKGFRYHHIAAQIGRSEYDLRRDYDPSFKPHAYASPAPAISEQEKDDRLIVASWGHMGLGGRRQFVMDTLYRANKLVPMNVLGGYASAQTIMRLRHEFGHDIIASKRGSGYGLTEKGRRVYEEHFAETQRPEPAGVCG